MKYILNAETCFMNVSPFGFYKYAKDFFDAGQSHKKGGNFSPVPYYLYCRSIELVLKSFLLDKRVSKKDLKENYGHNLIKLLSEIKKSFDVKPLSDSEEDVIKMADNYYSNKNKGFEYFEVHRAANGYSDLPDLLQLENISRKLLGIFKIKIN